VLGQTVAWLFKISEAGLAWAVVLEAEKHGRRIHTGGLLETIQRDARRSR